MVKGLVRVSALLLAYIALLVVAEMILIGGGR